MRKVAVIALGTALAFGAKWSGADRAAHAVDRLTFGARPGDVAAVERLGVKKWIDQQLDPQRIAEDPALERKLARFETLTMSTAEIAREYPLRAGRATPKMKQLLDAPREERRAMMAEMPEVRRLARATPEERRRMLKETRPQAVVGQDLMESKVLRAVYSNRQLNEVLTDFWFNHFNVYYDKGPVRLMTTSYERDAIRPHVLGKFKEMLRATAQHPAMLFYLDNAQSGRRGLNENYARELMELHTLGVDGGYTQKDVTEVARCLTGWSIRAPRMGGGFEFNRRFHEAGAKTVLGHTIAGGGQDEGFKVLEILAAHPSTAKFISRKLAQRFVADDPPAALVERMAKTFTKTDGDLREVMRSMFDSKEFWDERVYRAKVKSPFEMVVSAVRALDGQVETAFPLAQRIAQLGQPLYRKAEPTGYSNTGEEWINSASLLGRMNFATALAQGKIAGVTVETAKFEGLRAMSAETKKSIDAADGEQRVALALGSPEFQRR